MGEEEGILGGRPGLSKGVEDWAEEGRLLSEDGGGVGEAAEGAC